jgi:hypothetical protein
MSEQRNLHKDPHCDWTLKPEYHILHDDNQVYYFLPTVFFEYLFLNPS